MKDGDSRVQYGYANLKERAQHDMVVVENVRHGTRTIAARVVVAPDRRLINNLEEDGLWGAYKSISRAIGIITAGLGAKSFDPSRIRGNGSIDDEGALLVVRYTKWYDLCNKRYLAPLLVKKMIIDGLSPNALDKQFSFYNGATKKKVWECLLIWDEV